MKMPLDGRSVFVTGAGRGIGRGIAEAVAQAGADLALGDLDLAAASAAAELLRGRGRQALPLKLDVTDRASIDSALARAVESFGRIDGWVNNAGTLRMAAAVDVTREAWAAEMEVNLTGLFAACQAAAREMIRAGRGGAIVNVASNAGKVGYPNMAPYNAGKAAVISLTRSLSAEWAPHRINVNAVCPGGVDTPMLHGVAEWLAPRVGIEADRLHAQMKPHQMDPHIRPIEIGRAGPFLLSDHATVL